MIVFIFLFLFIFPNCRDLDNTEYSPLSCELPSPSQQTRVIHDEERREEKKIVEIIYEKTNS